MRVASLETDASIMTVYLLLLSFRREPNPKCPPFVSGATNPLLDLHSKSPASPISASNPSCFLQVLLRSAHAPLPACLPPCLSPLGTT